MVYAMLAYALQQCQRGSCGSEGGALSAQKTALQNRAYLNQFRYINLQRPLVLPSQTSIANTTRMINREADPIATSGWAIYKMTSLRIMCCLTSVCRCHLCHTEQLAYPIETDKTSLHYHTDFLHCHMDKVHTDEVGDLAKRRQRLFDIAQNSQTDWCAANPVNILCAATNASGRAANHRDIHDLRTAYWMRVKLISNTKPACMRKTMKPAKSNNKIFAVRVSA